MRRYVTFLFVLIVFLPTTILYGQPSTTSKPDTINIYRSDALKVLSKGYEAKALQAQRDLLFTQVDTLKARIVIKENIIFNLNSQITDYKNIVQSHENIIATQKDQRTLLEQQIEQKNKDLKKQRRKVRLTAFIGVLTTGIASYLFISK